MIAALVLWWACAVELGTLIGASNKFLDINSLPFS